MVDYHLHTNFSFDCNIELEDVVINAINNKLKTIYITDHYDFNYPHEDDFTFDVDRYFNEINRVQKKYVDIINIKIGIEIGLDLNYINEINNLIANYNFDFVIGSIHVIDNTDFYYGDFFTGKSIEQANTQYFENVLECVKTFNNFNSLGHLDYIIRYGTNAKNELDYERYSTIIDDIFLELIKKDIALELNTSGIRQGCCQMFPSERLIERYAQLGGVYITIGSDAHYIADIGADLKTAYSLADKYNLKLLELI